MGRMWSECRFLSYLQYALLAQSHDPTLSAMPVLVVISSNSASTFTTADCLHYLKCIVRCLVHRT